MRDFFIQLRDVQCIVEYEITDEGAEDANWIADVYPLNEDGTKGTPFELTLKEEDDVCLHCWEHYSDCNQGPPDWDDEP